MVKFLEKIQCSNGYIVSSIISKKKKKNFLRILGKRFLKLESSKAVTISKSFSILCLELEEIWINL